MLQTIEPLPMFYRRDLLCERRVYGRPSEDSITILVTA